MARRFIAIAQRRGKFGSNSRDIGELAPEVVDWHRAFVAASNREVVVLDGTACAAIVREALASDPALLEMLRPQGKGKA